LWVVMAVATTRPSTDDSTKNSPPGRHFLNAASTVSAAKVSNPAERMTPTYASASPVR
jgi:hypothetical protein